MNKLISTIIAIIFAIASIVVDNNFLSNSFILSLILQNIMVAPTTYKIFGEPYDNYKSYQP